MKYRLVLILLFISVLATAQDKFIIKSFSSIELNQIDEKQLLIEDSVELIKQKHVAPRFAYSTQVDISSNNLGEWYYDNKSLIWELSISSEKAKSLSVSFSEFDIPNSAKVNVLNSDRKVLSSFTQSNAFKNTLSTPPFKGNSIIIQYVSNEQLKGKLVISTIAQGYRDIFEKAEAFTKKDFGSAGACNNNVACTEADPWKDQVKSVAINILSSGTRWCSGCMIGTTRKDSTPYFLTAFHCIDRNDDGTISAAELADITTWTFHFNYESPDCSPSSDGDLTQSISGSSLVASYWNSDVALLKLSSIPPDSYEVFYAGWDRNNTPATSAVGIHHPNGDVKKISYEEEAIIDSPLDAINRWRVPNWNDGITEPGSSGSPLFSEFGRVVGQLYGGVATCGNLSDGSLTNDFDEYGKFSTSWSTGTTDAEKLEPWLDPDGLGFTEMDGYYNFPVSLNSNKKTINGFNIYPNPSTPEYVRIDLSFDTPEETGSISIYNISGQIVHTEIIPNNISRYKIYTDFLSYGSYYVEVLIGNEKITKPLIIVSK